MKKLLLVAALVAMVGLAPCTYAAQVEVHGDLYNRIQVYNDQQNFFQGDDAGDDSALDGTTDQFAEIKYRIWAEMATDDGAVKGVYGIELGALRFGNAGNDGVGRSEGGNYSGDGVNIETRWAYTDFMLGNGRLKFGLQPWTVNPYIWQETAMAAQYNGSAGSVDYTIGWARGNDYFNTTSDDAFIEDQDALLGRVNFGIGQGSKAGVFVMYQSANPSAAGTLDSDQYEVKNFNNIDMSIWTVGVDGKVMTSGPLFFAWDLMYQNGDIENVSYTDSFIGAASTTATMDVDLSAYFAHLDVGAKLGKLTLTYTGYYASGDDDPTDDDFDAFLGTDMDRTDSIIFQEGGYTTDFYFTERDYINDKGMWLNKLAVDYQINDKTKVGGAVLYLMTAEDIDYFDGATLRSESDLGLEFDAYISYKMYKNLELGLNAGYLLSGDAMDAFEDDANAGADEDIFRSTARIRYTF